MPLFAAFFLRRKVSGLQRIAGGLKNGLCFLKTKAYCRNAVRIAEKFYAHSAKILSAQKKNFVRTKEKLSAYSAPTLCAQNFCNKAFSRFGLNVDFFVN